MDKTADFGTANSGLVGTLGYTIYGAAWAVINARTTAGITELPGTGTYGFEGVAQTKTMQKIVWDTGGGSPIFATEDLILDEVNLYATARNESNSVTGMQTQYNEAGAVYEEAPIFKDQPGVDTYDGTGIERRDRYV